MQSSPPRLSLVLLGATVALGLGASAARPAGADTVSISMLAFTNEQPGLAVLIPNFERVYPSISVNVTYVASTASLYQFETTELAAGNSPDLLTVYPACGTPVSVCVLAKDGYLAPMLRKPWAKRSVPVVLSADKYGQGLFAFTPEVSPFGIFTNDNLFKKLGLAVPQTFSQVLVLCQKAKADGTVALVGSGDANSINRLVESLAVATVYAKDKRWTAELKAGTVTFDGTAGWHQALQEYADLYADGCFQPGVVGTPSTTAIAEFAQGQGLMLANTSTQKGGLDAAGPSFSYSFHPFPGGAAPGATATALNLNFSTAVSAHSSAANQAAAQAFVDFLARPEQENLYAKIEGGLTQYEFLKQETPSFMSGYASVLANHEYVILPDQTWWNPSVSATLAQYDVGLLTGQSSIDQILNAMDTAWKLGPS